MRSSCRLALIAGLLVAITISAAHAAVLWTFDGSINIGTYNAPCPSGLCGFDVPPASNPIHFTVTLDQTASTEVFAYSSTSLLTRYTMAGGLSGVDFGYRPEFFFLQFFLTVVDNAAGDSQPDQLEIFTNPATGPGAWFDLKFSSAGIAFLNGSALPSVIDLSLTDVARGTLYYSPNGVSSEYAAFEISSVTILQIPEPGTLALLSLGLVGLAAARRRKQ